MDKDRIQKGAEILEEAFQDQYSRLKERIEAFQKKCLSILPQKTIPLNVAIQIRDDYKPRKNCVAC